MLLVHGVTALCVTKLPETRGMKLGKVAEARLAETESMSNIESMELI